MDIEADTFMECWHRVLQRILDEGRSFVDDDNLDCLEISNLTVRVLRPDTAKEGIRVMRKRKEWRYPSEEELTRIMLHKDAESVYDYLYGQRLFGYDGVLNQIDDHVIPILTSKRTTRRAVAMSLNPSKDLRPDALNIPGISMVNFRLIEGKLEVTGIIRTSGFLTGWPANVFQLWKLQEYVAHALEVPLGSLTTISLSAHLHNVNMEEIREVQRLNTNICNKEAPT